MKFKLTDHEWFDEVLVRNNKETKRKCDKEDRSIKGREKDFVLFTGYVPYYVLFFFSFTDFYK